MSEEKYSVSKAKETKIANVIKRDGTMVPFDSDKIYNAIRKAGESTGEFGEQESYLLTAQVLKVLEHKFTETLPTIECIQDVVEQVLISPTISPPPRLIFFTASSAIACAAKKR